MCAGPFDFIFDMYVYMYMYIRICICVCITYIYIYFHSGVVCIELCLLLWLYVVIGLHLQCSDLRFCSRVLSKSKKVGQKCACLVGKRVGAKDHTNPWQPNSSYRTSTVHTSQHPDEFGG
jgi:hypothetical protein